MEKKRKNEAVWHRKSFLQAMEIRHYIPAEGKDLPGVRYTLSNNGRQEACIYESIRVGRAKGRRKRDKETTLYTINRPEHILPVT